MIPATQRFGTWTPGYGPSQRLRRHLAQNEEPAVAQPTRMGRWTPADVMETIGVVTVTGAAAWVGIRAGLKEKGTLKVAGWVGGVGSALIGLFFLNNKFDIVVQGPSTRIIV